jgi:hypothetical protein
MPRGARLVHHLAIPSMIVFNPEFPDQPPEQKSLRAHLKKSKSSKSVRRRRSTRLRLKELRQDSSVHRSIEKIALDCIDTIRDEEKDYLTKNEGRSLTKQRIRRGSFARRGSRGSLSSRPAIPRSSSRGALRKTTRYAIRRSTRETPDEKCGDVSSTEIEVDRALQNKFNKLDIVF